MLYAPRQCCIPQKKLQEGRQVGASASQDWQRALCNTRASPHSLSQLHATGYQVFLLACYIFRILVKHRDEC